MVGDKLTITDSDGSKVELAVDEIARNTTFVTELTTNSEFITKITNLLEGEYGNVVYDVTNNTFTYINEEGDVVAIDLDAIIKAKETNTLLAFDPATSLLTYTNEKGDNPIIDLSAVGIEPWNVQGGTEKASSNTEHIYQMGKVAIGAGVIPATDADGNAIDPELYVAGDVVITGKLWTANSIYADYVFEKYFTGYSDIKLDYEFPSLSNVAEFVKENHHLPGVTSIKEILKSENSYSFDLANLSIELLEKTEELYLHTIEQQKTIDEQQKVQEELIMQIQQISKRLNSLENQISK